MKPGTILILNFRGEYGYLCPQRSLGLSSCSIPPAYEKFIQPASWVLRVLDWLPDENRIYAEILDYRNSPTSFPAEQVQIAEFLKSVDKITFKSISTSGLMRTAKGGSTRLKQDLRMQQNTIQVNESLEHYHANEQVYKEIKLTFRISFNQISFGLGSVHFSRFIKEVNETIDFSIVNEDVRTEFDAVKGYFANKLGSKYITVNARITTINGVISEVLAESQEISRIDRQFIETIRFKFIKKMTRPGKWQIDKELFTPEEYYNLLTDQKLNANPFGDSDQELIEGILSIHDTKHYKNLRFLAKHHLKDILKLRFILKPFSFIFLLEGKNKYHIIWETLDTEEATYLWDSDKSREQLKKRLDEIEHIIHIVKVQGKTAYLNSDLLHCRRIYHDYSDLTEGFIRWKGELESALF